MKKDETELERPVIDKPPEAKPVESKPEVPKYRFIGHNAHGYVSFERNGETVTYHIGEAVETPAWLASKLGGNPDFELATGDDSGLVSRRARKP